MKRLTQDWIRKAEGNWISAQRDARARRQPNYDMACFSAQQCAEKYLKARLQEAGLRFPKTHDLVKLLNRVLGIEPTWNLLRNELKFLNSFAVDYRYPGADATRDDARDAIESCRLVREVVRQSFGLPL